MIDIAMFGPAAIGFVLGAPSGALLLGAMRWVRRPSSCALPDLNRNSDRESKGRPRPTPRVLPAAATTSIPAARQIVAAAGSQSLVGRRLPARRPRTAEEHALELARWVLEPVPGGLRGRTVTAVELLECYGELCGEICCEARPWQGVAVAFMKLLGIDKRYGSIEGRRVRLYSLPDRDLDEILAERAVNTRNHATNPNRTPHAITEAVRAAA